MHYPHEQPGELEGRGFGFSWTSERGHIFGLRLGVGMLQVDTIFLHMVRELEYIHLAIHGILSKLRQTEGNEMRWHYASTAASIEATHSCVFYA